MASRKHNPLYKPKFPRPRKEEAEFGRGKREFAVCPTCSAVYYKKSWHHEFPRTVGEGARDKRMDFTMCPACRMIRDNMYEGQLIIRGVPQERIAEVLARIKNVGNQAYRHDPLDRIIRITRRGQVLEALTTENQLALKLSRQIQEILREKPKIMISKDESIVRVIIEVPAGKNTKKPK